MRERALVIFISARNQGDIEGRDTRLMSALRSLGGGIAGLKSWPVRGVWSFSVPSAFLSCAIEDLLAESWSGMDSKSLMSSMKRVCGCPEGRLMGMVERQGFIFYVELHAIV